MSNTPPTRDEWRFPDLNIPDHLRDGLRDAFATLHSTCLNRSNAVNSHMNTGFSNLTSALDVLMI